MRSFKLGAVDIDPVPQRRPRPDRPIASITHFAKKEFGALLTELTPRPAPRARDPVPQRRPRPDRPIASITHFAKKEFGALLTELTPRPAVDAEISRLERAPVLH